MWASLKETAASGSCFLPPALSQLRCLVIATLTANFTTQVGIRETSSPSDYSRGWTNEDKPSQARWIADGTPVSHSGSRCWVNRRLIRTNQILSPVVERVAGDPENGRTNWHINRCLSILRVRRRRAYCYDFEGDDTNNRRAATFKILRETIKDRSQSIRNRLRE